jgi:hypothetical protein
MFIDFSKGSLKIPCKPAINVEDFDVFYSLNILFYYISVLNIVYNESFKIMLHGYSGDLESLNFLI